MSRNVMDQDFGSEEEDDDFNPAAANDSDEERESKVCFSSGSGLGTVLTTAPHSRRITTRTMTMTTKTM